MDGKMSKLKTYTSRLARDERGSPAVEFALILPFTPQNRQNLVAWMAARSDGDNYGQIIVYADLPFGKQRMMEVCRALAAEPRFAREAAGAGGAGPAIDEVMM